MKGVIVLKHLIVYIASVIEFALRFLFVYAIENEGKNPSKSN